MLRGCFRFSSISLPLLGLGLGLLGGGCDISVKPFAGTVMQMTINAGPVSGPNEHYEIWARDQYNDILRVSGKYDVPAPIGGFTNFDKKYPYCTSDGHCVRFGIMFREAVSMGDPCMIDKNTGALLVTAAAYKQVTINGVTQSPEEQAAAIRARIAQLTTKNNCDQATPPHCGIAPTNLVAVLPYDPTPPPTIPFDTPATMRLGMCQAYWAASPYAYTPNPSQLTFPLNGTVYGTTNFNTTPPLPPTNYDGFRIDSPVNMKGIQELFITHETVDAADMAASRADGVDPENRGPLFLQGLPDQGGLEVVHFDLSGASGEAGTAALYVDLDENPSAF
jgi:hypothetical protein